jgi:hypothetical protein
MDTALKGGKNEEKRSTPAGHNYEEEDRQTPKRN